MRAHRAFHGRDNRSHMLAELSVVHFTICPLERGTGERGMKRQCSSRKFFENSFAIKNTTCSLHALHTFKPIFVEKGILPLTSTEHSESSLVGTRVWDNISIHKHVLMWSALYRLPPSPFLLPLQREFNHQRPHSVFTKGLLLSPRFPANSEKRHQLTRRKFVRFQRVPCSSDPDVCENQHAIINKAGRSGQKEASARKKIARPPIRVYYKYSEI